MARFTPVGVNFMVRGFGAGQRQLQVLNRSIIGLGRAGRISATGIGLMGGALIAATAAVAGIAGAVTGSTKAAMDLEDAWTGVLKTTEGLGDSFDDLTPLGERLLKNFRDLSTEIPFTSVELSEIAEIAGQVGIAEEDLLDFTRVIADMAVSTSLNIQDASFAMGRFSTVMQTTREDIRRIGDVIVWLGNTFPATESEIAAFLPRIGALGKMFRISEADLLGMASALAAMGINAQAGSTAIQRTFSRIQLAISEGGKEFELLARIMQTTTDELERNFAERPMEVFKNFILALRNMGSDSTLVLRELQLSTARYLPALLGLAETYNSIFIPAVDGANEAWEENSALTEEAGKFYATTRSQIKTTMNVIRNMLETVGLPMIKWLKDWLEANRPILIEFAEKLPDLLEKDVIPAVKSLAENIMVFFQFIKDNREPLTQIIKGFAALMIVSKVAGAVAGLSISFGFLKSLGIVRLITGIGGAIGGLVPAFSWFISTVQRTGKWMFALRGMVFNFRSQLGILAPILLRVGSILGGIIPVLVSVAGFLLKIVGAIVSVKLAIAALVLAIAAYITNFMGFRDRVNEFIGELVNLSDTLKERIISAIDDLVAEMPEAGKKIVDGLKMGLLAAFPALQMDFRGGLQKLRDLLPFSEPADSSSPLSGFEKAGKAIVDKIRVGIKTATPKAVKEMKNLAQQMKDALLAFADDFEKAGEELLSVYLNRGITKGALVLLDTSEKILNILRIGLANPLTQELQRSLIEQFNVINEEVIKGMVKWSDLVNFLTAEEMAILEKLMMTGGKSAGEALALGLELAFPAFQRIVGIYIEHMNAILSFFGIKVGVPKITGIGGKAEPGPPPSGMGGKKGAPPPGIGEVIGEFIRGIGDTLKDLIDDWKRGIVDGLGDAADDAGDAGETIKEGAEDLKEAAGILEEAMSRLEFLSQLSDSLIRAADFFAEQFRQSIEQTLAGTVVSGNIEKGFVDVIKNAFGTPFVGPRKEYIKMLEEATAKLFKAAGELSQAFSPLEFLPNIAGQFIKLGQFMGQRVLDPIKKSLDGIDAEIQKVLKGEVDTAALEEERLAKLREQGVDVERLLELEAERLRLQRQYNTEQEKLLALEQQRERFNFLQEQLNLIKFIKEQGLDPARILGGIDLGLGADPAAFLAKATEALKQIISRLNQELKVTTTLFDDLRDPSELEDTKDVLEEINKAENILNQIFGPDFAFDVIRYMKGARNFSAETLAIIEHYFDLKELYNTLLPIEQGRLQIQKDMAEEAAKLLDLENKRAQLELLQQQIDLIETLRELGLDPAEVFAGIKLGLQTDMGDFLDLMLRMLEETIKAMDDELQISSPSKVFFERGKMMISGLIKGAESMIPSLQATVGSAMRQVAVMPMLASASPAMNQQNVFNTTINSDMEMAQFEQRVLRVVRSDLG